MKIVTLKSLLAMALTFCLSAGVASAATIAINFGDATDATNWNNIVVPTNDILDLAYLDGSSSGYALITDDDLSFTGTNPNGTSTPGSPASDLFPGSVSRTSLYGNSTLWDGQISPLVVLTLDGLNASNAYQFSFFASRMGAGDIRETEYKLIGGTTEMVYLDAASNVSNYVQSSFILPDDNGQIRLEIQKGPLNNNDPTEFFYLGAMRIDETPIPEPTSLVLLGLAGAGLAVVRRRSRR